MTLRNVNARHELPRNRNTSHSKYEAIYVLAKAGLSQQTVVELTLADIEVTKDSMTIKGTKLDLEQAKAITAYLHEHGTGIGKFLFYGNNKETPCSIPTLRKGLTTHLRREHGITLEDIGWNSVRTVPAPLVINGFEDIAKLVGGLQGKTKKTPSN